MDFNQDWASLIVLKNFYNFFFCCKTGRLSKDIKLTGIRCQAAIWARKICLFTFRNGMVFWVSPLGVLKDSWFPKNAENAPWERSFLYEWAQNHKLVLKMWTYVYPAVPNAFAGDVGLFTLSYLGSCSDDSCLTSSSWQVTQAHWKINSHCSPVLNCILSQLHCNNPH